MYNIPILFILFNRKDVALRGFKPIMKIKPSKLYIAGDGAREYVKDETIHVSETRNAILSCIDWECEVHTLFQENNLGCCNGVYSAINWLFDNENQGIIIEDDCVMRDSFFPLLRKCSSDIKVIRELV